MTTALTGRQRAPEPTAGLMLHFDLDTEIAGLRSEPAWQSGRNAKTLVKYPDFRVVLTVLKPGVTIHEHRAAGRISVQTVTGHIRMRVQEHTFDLPQGAVLVLDRAVAHDVEAVEESAFLLTMAWPE